jgi:hypothetical protein
MPKCPNAPKDQFNTKLQCYMDAGCWIPATVREATPMLCILKKNGKLHTIVDCQPQNDNTVKDITPFPDQDTIRHEVAKARFHSKLDMSEAYEQICVHPDHVLKTAFSTIYGTYLSAVMQQGDCNTPSTFQHLMMLVTLRAAAYTADP